MKLEDNQSTSSKVIHRKGSSRDDNSVNNYGFLPPLSTAWNIPTP